MLEIWRIGLTQHAGARLSLVIPRILLYLLSMSSVRSLQILLVYKWFSRWTELRLPVLRHCKVNPIPKKTNISKDTNTRLLKLITFYYQSILFGRGFNCINIMWRDWCNHNTIYHLTWPRSKAGNSHQ